MKILSDKSPQQSANPSRAMKKYENSVLRTINSFNQSITFCFLPQVLYANAQYVHVLEYILFHFILPFG